MKIESSGVTFTGTCDVQTSECTATITAPITAVWGSPGRIQINVCGACLRKMVRCKKWVIPGTRVRG